MNTSILETKTTQKSKTSPSLGFVTLPVESGKEDLVRQLIHRWGADAIRDSDGTELSEELKTMDLDIYSVICLVRAEQEWPRTHPQHLPQKFLMSEPESARTSDLRIDLMKGFHPEKYRVDTINDHRRYWEVINRTTGKVLPDHQWDLDAKTNSVLIKDCQLHHIYTVNFLAYVIWDATSMYNHITNNWDRPHVMSVDPYHKEAREHLMQFYRQWLKEHPQTGVVRLTTLAYHFAVDSAPGPKAPDRFRDWTGYQETISIEALEDFAKEYGYRMRAEDFVDQGFYNHTSRIPSQRYLDWIDFIHRFVVEFGREMVQLANQAGKRTGIFWGDHWTGVEPYSPDFQKMGIDIHIGAAEDGVALRRVSDAPGPQTKELRFYPYFFPDVFSKGGNPISESLDNWIKIRRALSRKSIDRIGYGGYLSLAADARGFVEHVEGICNEFRSFKENPQGEESWKVPVKVAFINAWGKKRAWINSFGIPQKFLIKRQDVIQVAGTNLQECLSGLPFEVEWLSFDDIAKNGIPADVDVLINDGDMDTAWSGGWWWKDPAVVSAVRSFVDNGGGLIGCRAPSAHTHQGRNFQLADVFGVERETGLSVQTACPKPQPANNHFIRTDADAEIDMGISQSNVFAISEDTTPLYLKDGHILAAANSFGDGRAVFLAELPYSLENSRLLHRAILWAAGKEEFENKGFSSNPLTDCACYPNANKIVLLNNSPEKQQTEVSNPQGEKSLHSLDPYECRWVDA